MALKVGDSCQLDGRTVIVTAYCGGSSLLPTRYEFSEGDRGTLWLNLASASNDGNETWRLAVVWDKDPARQPRPVLAASIVIARAH